MLDGFFSAFGTLLIVIVILYLARLATKYLGKSAKFKNFGGASRYITVLDQVAIGQDSSVAVVKIADRYFLLGIASSQVSILTELEGGEWTKLPPADTVSGMGMDFKDIMNKLKNRKK